MRRYGSYMTSTDIIPLYVSPGLAAIMARPPALFAAHESSRTTGLYDRRGDDVSLDEVERIVIRTSPPQAGGTAAWLFGGAW